MRAIRRLICSVTLMIAWALLGASVGAQPPINMVLYRDTDSLTLVIPSQGQPISLIGLRIVVTRPDGTLITRTLNDYPAFAGLPFNALPPPLCFRLERQNSGGVPPLICNNVSTPKQILNPADVFWYDSATNNDLNILIYSGDLPVLVCPSGDQDGCPMFYVTPTPPPTLPFTPNPTWTPTLPFTPTFTLTPTPTITPTPAFDATFGMSLANPVTRNADWSAVYIARYAMTDARGVEMLLVPAGRFLMGSSDPQIDAAVALCNQAAADEGAECQRTWYDDETPQHRQEIAVPFYIDRTEVTRASYQDCIDAGNCTETPDSEFSTQPDQPINRVTWTQAGEYCAWRGGRLPTEAEWEYAARGPDGLIFPWGDTTDGTESNHCDGNCGDADWASSYRYVHEDHDDGHAVTAPVASYAHGVSWVGAHDLAGNVWEWTATEYADYPYSESLNTQNTNSINIFRGGSFGYPMDSVRASDRNRDYPVNGSYDIGFRCAASRYGDFGNFA
jgi:formylglycine-generating enzyme required for sulfatase activity